MRQTILWILILMLVFLCGCRSSGQVIPPSPPEATANPKTDATMPSAKPVIPSTQPSGTVNPRGQLIGKAKDNAEAAEIAELYGITLVDFGHGLALYYTEEDPKAVIARGEENGWPALSMNYTRQPY